MLAARARDVPGPSPLPEGPMAPKIPTYRQLAEQLVSGLTAEGLRDLIRRMDLDRPFRTRREYIERAAVAVILEHVEAGPQTPDDRIRDLTARLFLKALDENPAALRELPDNLPDDARQVEEIIRQAAGRGPETSSQDATPDTLTT